jgi:RimJ/RimL family protein N-acetyltransferase
MDEVLTSIPPVTLAGTTIRLEPLSEAHIPDLEYACKDPPDSRRTIWRYLLDARLYREGGMQRVVKEFLARQAKGTDMPLAIIDLKSGNACGTTRFLEIQCENLTVEMATWIGLGYDRRVDAPNLESKYLMLQYAFEDLGLMRVHFKIDTRNFNSIDAIERIKATREGMARNHILLHDGTPRSSLLYSILDSEWPAVKLHMENLLARARR